MGGFKLGDNGLNLNMFINKVKLADFGSDGKLKKLFTLFDVDGNNELDSAEIKQLLTKFNKYASSNENSIFETEEVQQYLNETVDNSGQTLASNKIGVNDVFAFLKVLQVKEKTQTTTQTSVEEDMTGRETEELAVQTISDNNNKARALFDKQNRTQGKPKNSLTG